MPITKKRRLDIDDVDIEYYFNGSIFRFRPIFSRHAIYETDVDGYETIFIVTLEEDYLLMTGSIPVIAEKVIIQTGDCLFFHTSPYGLIISSNVDLAESIDEKGWTGCAVMTNKGKIKCIWNRHYKEMKRRISMKKTILSPSQKNGFYLNRQAYDEKIRRDQEENERIRQKYQDEYEKKEKREGSRRILE